MWGDESWADSGETIAQPEYNLANQPPTKITGVIWPSTCPHLHTSPTLRLPTLLWVWPSHYNLPDLFPLYYRVPHTLFDSWVFQLWCLVTVTHTLTFCSSRPSLMSADYWGSSQREKWQLTKQSLLDARRRVYLLERKMIHGGLIKDYPSINYDFNMRMYLHNRKSGPWPIFYVNGCVPSNY